MDPAHLHEIGYIISAIGSIVTPIALMVIQRRRPERPARKRRRGRRRARADDRPSPDDTANEPVKNTTCSSGATVPRLHARVATSPHTHPELALPARGYGAEERITSQARQGKRRSPAKER
jgi:hypothetical protein